MEKKILFITLSNIGDVILTLPVLDCLKGDFPKAQITVLSSERAKGIFAGNSFIDKFIIYDKRARLKEKLKLFWNLRKENFDLVVDLRDTFLGVFLKAQSKPLSPLRIPKGITHMKDRHLYRTGYKDKVLGAKNSLYVSPEDKEYISNLLKNFGIRQENKVIVISSGARSHTKRWQKEKFTGLAAKLIEEFNAKIVLTGDKEDAPINKYINECLKGACIDLSAKTTLGQLAGLLNKADLLVSNDSATMHLASYLNIPLVAIFGITDDKKYGSWSEKSAVVKKEIYCRPCQKAQCRFRTLECMKLVRVEDVLRQVENIFSAKAGSRLESNNGRGNSKQTQNKYKRILIVRTDRIGDVLLSTPVIRAVRQNYPHAFIAMMVSPYTKEIVDGNPYLDEIITYDKDGKHKSWMRSIKFARNLSKKRFDLALILHPTNRLHLVTYLAGIKRRVGYGRKMGFLLTDRINDTKQRGEKHELEYNLDLLRYLGIEPKEKYLYIPIKPESENWAEELLKQEGVAKTDKLLAIHPGASCPSRIWPAQNYAAVADKLSQRYGFKVFILAGPHLLDSKAAEDVIKYMRSPAVNLARKTSLSQVTSLIKRCKLLISTDTGPMHIATAVGTPQVVIFGRSQPGLSPLRWGPTSEKHRILHKTVGCIECLAHNCKKEFACLKAISVEDVIAAASAILS